MVQLFDLLQVIFWALTYLQIVFFEIKNKNMPIQYIYIYMPYISGALNFAWEINAVISSGGQAGHVLWIALDVVIAFFNLRRLKQRRGIWLSCVYAFVIVSCVVGFRMIFQISSGMLISVFSIDMIMAVEFIASFRNISSYGKVSIAVTKMLGDMFAWLCYMKTSPFVVVVGMTVLLLNLFYFTCCLEEVSSRKNSGRRRKLH